MLRSELRTIEYNGTKIFISCDNTGSIFVNDRRASRPIITDGLNFVWGSEKDGLPPNTKIALSDEIVMQVEALAKDYNQMLKDIRKKEIDYDNLYNDGGEGYNPYRDGGPKGLGDK